jgi:hypothetical protein
MFLFYIFACLCVCVLHPQAIKTMIRTKSGRLIEKTIFVTEEDYKKMMEEGGDPAAILNRYLKPEERGTIESWEKAPEPGLKVNQRE